MGDEDIVLPADDNNFQSFKNICKDQSGWTEVYNKKGLTVNIKPQENSNIKLMRAHVVFNDVSAATLFDVVHDTKYRRKWDKDMIAMDEVCKLCVNNSVTYYAVKCPPPIKNRDCIFLCSWIAYPNMRNPEEYIMINRSLSHKDYPPKSNMVRAISIITGYHIKPIGENKTELTYLTHFDPRGSVPKWVVNKITQIFTPKVIKGIHKAAIKYPAWKRKNDEHIKPWLWPEQNNLPRADPNKLSNRVDDVPIIDETNVAEEVNGDFNNNDSD